MVVTSHNLVSNQLACLPLFSRKEHRATAYILAAATFFVLPAAPANRRFLYVVRSTKRSEAEFMQ